VIVGNSTAIIFNRAQTALDAGDLAGAVNAVESLNPQPGQPLATWLTDAKALLEARTALAQMAERA
jgi:hypothetical protein